jgi:predicted protein tyrosine phosphatase
MMIHVCPLSRLDETVTTTGARHVVTLVNEATPMTRPAAVAEADHLVLAVSDIVEALDGHIVPAEAHLERLIAFASVWDRTTPLVVHCYAGVSRSTAAAYVIACALDPGRDEMEAAVALRAASPTATPNRRIVSIADRALARSGRMVAAIETIGYGAMATEAAPFRLALE